MIPESIQNGIWFSTNFLQSESVSHSVVSDFLQTNGL